jgi:TonB family protein
VTKPEKLDRWIVMSILLHAGMVVVALFSPALFKLQGSEAWGGASAGDAINVKIEGSFSGIALPAPEVTRDNAVANDSKGLYKTEPEPPAPPPEKAEPIPEKTAPVKTPKAAKAAPPAPPKPQAVPKKPTPQPDIPSNAVPYGGGGQPTLSYGQFTTQGGPAGAMVGDGAFGAKYGPYVQAMIRKISQNWLQGLVDKSINQAPRVYVSFDIDSNGNISNIDITQSSGFPSLDNSAKRALYASNPLQPLPKDYTGSKVSVSFYFEYVK